MQHSDDALAPVLRSRGRRSWRHFLSLSMVALLLVSMLAACGGGDDDDDDDVTPTTGAAAATATTAPSSTAASPTTAVEPTSTTAPSPTATTPPASPTTQATAPPRPIATQPLVVPSATTGTDGGSAAIEDAMISVLITNADLGTGWTQDELGPDESEGDNSSNICDVADFPDKDAKIAQVESQVLFDDGTVGGLYAENLTAFPLEIAEAAFDYAVEGVSCGTFTDDDGNVHVLTPVDDPGLGDESAAYAWSFTANGQELTGFYAFVRVGPYVALFGWLGLPALDDDAMVLVTVEAVDRITDLAVSQGLADGSATDLQSQVEGALLTVQQLDSIEPGWTLLGPSDIDLDDRYAICDAVSFADIFNVEAEAANAYELAGTFEGNLQHALVVLADGEGVAAAEQLRLDVQCGSWTDSDGSEVVVTVVPDPPVGDESIAALLELTLESGELAYAGIVYTRWLDVISVVAIVSTSTINPVFFEAAQLEVLANIEAS